MPFKYPSPKHRIVANSVIRLDLIHNGTPCLIWTGAVTYNRNGVPYPKIATRFKRGPRKGRVRTENATRYVVREIHRRLLSKRQPVRHLCNQTLCVNWLHICGGTQRENIRQCVAEGRHKTPFRRSAGERYAAAAAS